MVTTILLVATGVAFIIFWLVLAGASFASSLNTRSRPVQVPTDEIHPRHKEGIYDSRTWTGGLD